MTFIDSNEFYRFERIPRSLIISTAHCLSASEDFGFAKTLCEYLFIFCFSGVDRFWIFQDSSEICVLDDFSEVCVFEDTFADVSDFCGTPNLSANPKISHRSISPAFGRY